jgi:hypothetical protein
MKRKIIYLLCVLPMITIYFSTITGCSQTTTDSVVQTPQLSKTTSAEAYQTELHVEDTAIFGEDLETSQVIERGAWRDLLEGRESHDMVRVSPILRTAPGDTVTLDVATWGGYRNYISNVEIVPEQAPASQWNSQQLYQKRIEWPETISIPPNADYVGHDAKSFQVEIPRNVSVPVNVEIHLDYEFARYAGSKIFTGKEYSTYPMEKVYKLTLGPLTGISDVEAFQLKDWFFTDGSYNECSIWLSYNSKVDSKVDLIGPDGAYWQAVRNREDDETWRTPPIQTSLSSGATECKVRFATPHHETGVDYNNGAEYTLEFRECFTNTLLFRKTLIYERGEISIKSVNNSWSFIAETQKQKLQQTTIAVNNSGRFPILIYKADFIIDDKVSQKTWEKSLGDYYYISPGENTLTYKPDISLPGGEKAMNLNLFTQVILSRTAYPNPTLGKPPVQSNVADSLKVASYRADVFVPETP